MPNIAAGLGLLGVGVMVVVAVGTIAYSLLYDQPHTQNHEQEYSSYTRNSYNRRATWDTPDSSTSTPTPTPTAARIVNRKRKKKDQRTSLEFIVSDLCSICKEFIRKTDVLTKLPCNHCFHFQCINDWFDTCAGSVMETGTCPMCRKNFSAQDLTGKSHERN